MSFDITENFDPRQYVLDKRFENVGRIFAFASGKGGVGKSSLSTAAALSLAKQGKKTGLLDFDFYGASDHLFLGAELSFPEENAGILPLEAAFGLKFMSIAAFTGEQGVPMRGPDVTNAILELLAVTIWGDLDYLIIDMPPGIGDEVLDLIRYIRKSEILIISTPSVVSVRVVKRLLDVFVNLNMKVAGVVENMVSDEAGKRSLSEAELSAADSVPFLGRIPVCPDLEKAIGKPEELLKTSFVKKTGQIISGII